MCYIDSQFCQFHRMLSMHILHITLNTSQRRSNSNYKVFDTSTEWCRNNEWCQITKVDAPETNQPTQTPSTFHCLEFATNQPGEVLVFYMPIRFFYYLANLIIFTRSSRIPCIFFLEGEFKGIYLREKNFTLSYVVSEI